MERRAGRSGHGTGGTPAGQNRAAGGRRVLVTRSPERSGTLAEALRLAGAVPLLLPLTAAERAPDQAALDDAFEALGAGSFDWLVVSSATTVLALQEKAAERAVELGRLASRRNPRCRGRPRQPEGA